MTVWRLITHHKDPERLLAQAMADGWIAVGWNALDDLATYTSEAEIKKAVRETGYPNWPFSGRQLLAFRDAMKPGDLVILSTGKRRAAVMRIEGDYKFAGSNLRDEVIYAHRRAASVVRLNPDGLWQTSGGAAEGQSLRWTLVRCRYEVSSEGDRIAVPSA